MVTGMEAGNRLVLSRNNLSLHMPGKGCVLSKTCYMARIQGKETKSGEDPPILFYKKEKKGGGGG